MFKVLLALASNLDPCFQLSYIYKWKIFSALCRGGMVLWSAKVPKALCQSSNGLFTQPRTHQKTAALRFVC